MALKHLLLSAVLWGLTTSLASAQVAPLQLIEEVELPFLPRDAVFSEDERYLVVVGNRSRAGGVLLRDLWDQKNIEFTLPRGVAETVVYDTANEMIHVVATTDAETIVYRFAPKTLTQLGETEITRLTAATVYVDDVGRLMVGGVPDTPKDRSIVVLADGEIAPTQLQASFLREPVQNIWWSSIDKRTFVNMANSATFQAIPGSSREEIGFYNITSSSGDDGASTFAIAGAVEGRAGCNVLNDGAPTTFVAASAQLSAVTLLEFDPSFGQFDAMAVSAALIRSFSVATCVSSAAIVA